MSEDPRITGIHHVGITVSDLGHSLSWYTRVLGFTEVTRFTIGPMSKAMVRLGPVALSLVSHGAAAVGGLFDEHRAGLDHLSLAVPDPDGLRAWAARLDEAGVEHSGVVKGATGSLIAFRDPDNIALELYTLG
ncbi:VOC family protein [uncultured Propionibacterium sp.]|uniref:VOC family protein n=1 Tax=uncultured Propionibacterium sp. TaxID=218066 RepID=UPI002931DF90|nr:VOC family protein [uncultured Propionibacterium sp.]